MAFKIKHGPSCLWLTMLSSLTEYGRRAAQRVSYLTGDQQIWSSNESYHLPSKTVNTYLVLLKEHMAY